LSPIPSYAFPESAAAALARVVTHAEWRQKPDGTIPAFPRIDPARATRVIEKGLGCGGGWLPHEDVRELLDAAGIEQAPSMVADSRDAAVAAADRIGYPVAVKGTGPALLHKTERHAVRLDLETADDVRAACDEMRAALGADLRGFLVQRMIRGGVEMIAGVTQDQTFGPLILCGMGGVLVDILGDSSFRLHPLTRESAREMAGELRGAKLLRGYRGSNPVDEKALEDLLLRLSALAGICPDIQEADFNPVKVLEHGAIVVDARIRVERTPPRPSRRGLEY
jgi:acyl-CoA synthetase (NDP forming)